MAGSGYAGKLIVIEGTDGSGKATQTNMLIRRLLAERISVGSFSFPQYGKKSAGLIEEYLNGKYGPADAVHPYAASLFYALDRFDASFRIRNLLEEGYVVILDRYVDSNACHQGGKIDDNSERELFWEWLYTIEYKVLRAPGPDLVCILRVPATVSQELIATKQQRLYIEGGKTTDEHESNLDHLKRAEQTYVRLAEHEPVNHRLIECVRDGALLSKEEVHELVWNEVKHVVEGMVFPS